MTNFKIEEIIIIIKEILNSIKEEEITNIPIDYYDNLPNLIKNKLDLLSSEEYFIFIKSAEGIAEDLLNEYDFTELNSLNKIHEHILINSQNLKIKKEDENFY